MRCVVCAVLLWGSWLCLARGQTADAPALHWVRGPGAESCINPRQLAERVSSITGSVLVEPTSAARSIEGYVQQLTSGEYEVRVRSSGRDGAVSGERQFRQAGPCRTLDPAIAFVIAVLIDPDLTFQKLPPELVGLGAEGPTADERLLTELEQNPPRPAASAATTLPPAQAPARAPEVGAAAARSRSVGAPNRFELSAALNLALAELPRVGFGPALGFGYLLRHVALEAQVRGLFSVDSWVVSNQSFDAPLLKTTKLDALLLACPRLTRGTLLLEGCLGAEVGYLRAHGNGELAGTAHLMTLAGTFALGLGLQVTRGWTLRLRGLLLLNVLTPSLVYQGNIGRSELFHTSIATGSVQLGVSYGF